MKKRVVTKSELQRAKKLLARHKNIQLAYVFGSAAKGRPPRDIDIAILLARKLPPLKRLSFRTELAGELEQIFKKEVDIALLNQASPFFKFQVLKHGILLFTHRKRDNTKLRYDTMTEYFDCQPLCNFFAKKLEERLGI